MAMRKIQPGGGPDRFRPGKNRDNSLNQYRELLGRLEESRRSTREQDRKTLQDYILNRGAERFNQSSTPSSTFSRGSISGPKLTSTDGLSGSALVQARKENQAKLAARDVKLHGIMKGF